MSDEIDPRFRQQMARMGSPIRFGVTATYGAYLRTRHMAYIFDQILPAIVKIGPGQPQRFFYIHAPVRHSKSFSLSRVLPAWCHGMFPTLNSLLISKGDDLSTEHSRFARDLLKEWGPELFGIKVAADNTAANRWAIEKFGGTMRAVGINGDITGRGADLMLIEDPFPNPESPSKAESQKIYDRWNGTIRSRLMPGGVCIATFSRWGDDDLWGRWQDAMLKGGDQWTEIWLPALAECPDDEDPKEWRDDLGRAHGDALWPEFWSRETLEGIRANSYANDGGFNWESQYQGRPMGRSGGMFERERWVTLPGVDPNEIKESVRGWDLAATSGAKGDFTVGAKLDRLWNGKTVVSDIVRVRQHAGEIERVVVETALRDGTHVKIRMEEERAGAGKANTARYGSLLNGFDFAGSRVEGNKEERARGFVAQQYLGNIYLVRGPWLEDLMAEFERFPRGRHDDIVDACVTAFNNLNDTAPAQLMEQSWAERGFEQVDLRQILNGEEESDFDSMLFGPTR